MAKDRNRNRSAEEVITDGDVVEATAEELTEGKKKREPSRRTVLQKEILAYVVEHAGELTGPLGEKAQEFAKLPGRQAGGGTRGPSIAGQLKAMILEEKEIHEDIFYQKFKLGRLEMKRRFYNMRKKVSDPAEAVWVSFDPDTGIYKLEGTGAEPPANWVD